MQTIYLDNSMTTRPSEKALSEMFPYFTDMWGTPSAPHQKGQDLFPAIKESYLAIYELLGASERDTVIFTSSGAEAVNHALMSIYHQVTSSSGRNHYITSNIDEAPTLMVMGRLEEMGCVSSFVPVDQTGKISIEALGDAMTPRTVMVSLSWANGLTGVVQPVEEIAALCKERGIILHLDATHILGKLYFDIEELGVDLISFNGDHLHAPQGTGGLFIKAGVRASPFILGGMEQGGNRAGSYSVPGLIGLGVAAKEALESRDLLCLEVARLRGKLENAILDAIPDAVVFFKDQERVPHCTTIGFGGISNEALLYLLNRKGVLASIGGGSFQQIGLVLTASGVDETLAHSALSFSLSRETTEQEVDRAAKMIIECVNKLKQASSGIFEEKD